MFMNVLKNYETKEVDVAVWVFPESSFAADADCASVQANGRIVWSCSASLSLTVDSAVAVPLRWLRQSCSIGFTDICSGYWV
jgi:hypothetical protein